MRFTGLDPLLTVRLVQVPPTADAFLRTFSPYIPASKMTVSLNVAPTIRIVGSLDQLAETERLALGSESGPTFPIAAAAVGLSHNKPRTTAFGSHRSPRRNILLLTNGATRELEDHPPRLAS